MSVANKRILFLDVLRVIATVAVIVLHASAPICYKVEPNSRNWITCMTVNSLTRFAVPLFVLISGFLLLSKHEPLGQFMEKRFKGIIVPFMVWSFFYGSWMVYNGAGIKKEVTLFFQADLVYHLWFVYMIIGLYLICPVLKEFCRERLAPPIIYYILFLFMMPSLVMIIEKYLHLPLSKTINYLFLTSSYVGYFILGYYLPQIEIRSDKTILWLWLIGICSFVWIAVGTITDSITGMSYNDFWQANNSLPVMMATLIIFALAFHYGEYLEPYLEKFKRIIVPLSNACFTIYLIHAFVLDRIVATWLKYDYQRYNTWVVVSGLAVGTCAGSSITAVILHKIPWLRKII